MDPKCEVCRNGIGEEDTARCCKRPICVRWSHFHATYTTPNWSTFRYRSNAVCLNCYEDFVFGP